MKKKLPLEGINELTIALDEEGAIVRKIMVMLLKNGFFIFHSKGNHGVELCSECMEKLRALFLETEFVEMDDEAYG